MPIADATAMGQAVVNIEYDAALARLKPASSLSVSSAAAAPTTAAAPTAAPVVRCWLFIASEVALFPSVAGLPIAEGLRHEQSRIETFTRSSESAQWSNQPHPTVTALLNDYVAHAASPSALQSLCFLVLPLRENEAALVAIYPSQDQVAAELWVDSPSNAFPAMIQRHLELGLSHIYSIRAKRRSDLLLEVARKLLDTSGEIDDLLKRIVAQTRELTGADRCSFFLVDKERNELYAKIFDLNAEPQPTTDQAALPASLNPQPSTEIRFPINRGIAAHVYQTGELLNLENAYKNEMFNSDIDGVTGFVTTSLLTIPVFNNGEVIGVIQAMNKAPRFTKADEADGVAFAVLAGLALHQSLMMEERVKAEHHAKVALEILAYHRQINPEQLSALTSEPTIDVHAKFPGFATLSFQGRLAVPLDQTIRCCVFMLEDLEILQRWRTPRETAIKFLLTLQLGYRDVPYHNWMHAFSVAQFCYVLARKAGLLEAVGLDEVAALFISCLGHDVDHRGTTNNFQKLAGSSLATLYSSMGSVLERHHLAQTLYILQVDGCNLLANVESSEYRKVLDRIRRNILATDLASHFAIQKRTEAMLVQRETTAPDQLTPTEKSNATHLICCLIMTACDLSDAGKPWESASLVAELIYAEFFAQGDLERARGEKPMEINDRTTANKPKLQLGFIDHVAMPAFKFLSRALPLASEVEGAVLRNRQRWQALLDGSST